jgi:hypothetical protein
MAGAMSGPQLDRDAILAALQDQIDDLTAAVAAQQRLLDAHARLIIELTSLAGLGERGSQVRPPRPDRPVGGANG